MKVNKYARDLQIGDKLYHWDCEGGPEPISSISKAYNQTHEGRRIENIGYLVIRCQSYNILVHRNDIRKIEL